MRRRQNRTGSAVSAAARFIKRRDRFVKSAAQRVPLAVSGIRTEFLRTLSDSPETDIVSGRQTAGEKCRDAGGTEQGEPAVRRPRHSFLHPVKCSGAVFLMLFSVAALCGCGRLAGSSQEQETVQSEFVVVGFSEVGAESDWRVANSESMKNTFTEANGYELLFEDARQKQDNQIESLRNFIVQEVDYIVLAPIVETGWDEVLTEAQEAGIPVIVVDRMVNADEALYDAWVGSDFEQEGQTAVQWLSDYLEKQGRGSEEISIVHVKGTPGASAQLGRTAGLEEGLSEHENWTLAAQVEGEFTQAKSYEEIQGLLEEGVSMDVVYCENDESALGAIQALEEAGIRCGVDGDVIIISFDATNAGLTACLEGKINLDVECNPLHGPRVEKIIRQLENGETPQKKYYVEETSFEAETITQEMIDEREY